MLRTTNLARLCGLTCNRAQGSYVTTRLLRTSSSRVMLQTCLENARKSDSKWNLLFTPGACMFVTAVVLASSTPPPAEAGWWPFTGWGKRERRSRSHFDDVVPREGKKQRTRAEAEMRAYLEKMRVPVQELMSALREGKVSREEFNHKMSSFNNEVELETHRIIFGAQDPPDARRRFEAEHGKCRYTPEAIKAVAALSPLVEIGADRGQWQRALVAQGATVISYAPWAVPPDSYHTLPPQVAPVGTVLPGDETAIRQHRDKTLLLVYPPPGDMALRCLQEYRGDALVYVGEGRGGVNSCDDFFEQLDAEWEVVAVMELDPFPQCFEKLFVLRRNRAKGTSGCTETAEAA